MPKLPHDDAERVNIGQLGRPAIDEDLGGDEQWCPLAHARYMAP